MERAVLALALLFGLAVDAHADELKNWFGDPYFQVRDAIPACPVPRGPLMTGEEMRRSAHARAERGTRCWQEGQCAKPNAYMYDAGIADEVKRRFTASQALQRASLWVTVQRRFVYVEGCAPAADVDQRVARVVHGVPDVEQVIVHVGRDPAARPPYAAVPR